MKTIIVQQQAPSARQLSEIVRDLREGAIMIWPTDTLYAIACDALNPKAIERICRLKGINPDKTNLSIACESISQAAEYARISDRSFNLMKETTPGPVTFLLPASSSLPRAFRRRKTVGIRIPDNPVALQIIEALGNPVMTTSIAYEDEDHAVSPGLIAENYEGDIDFFVEAGDGATEASTIVDCTGNDPELVRPGKAALDL